MPVSRLSLLGPGYQLHSAGTIEPARHSSVMSMRAERHYRMAGEWQATQWEDRELATQKLGRAPAKGLSEREP